jgi:hypothetical protein
LGLSACGGGDDTTTQPTGSPLVETSSPAPSATPTPTPVDPTVAAKAKVMADYKLAIATQGRGIVSNHPAFPYQQVLTGNALSKLKSAMSGAQLAGVKYSGQVRFVKGEVTALNLKAKPATATVQSCVFDGLKATSKTGKVTASSGDTSRADELVLVDGRWKITESESFEKTEPGCA